MKHCLADTGQNSKTAKCWINMTLIFCIELPKISSKQFTPIKDFIVSHISYEAMTCAREMFKLHNLPFHDGWFQWFRSLGNITQKYSIHLALAWMSEALVVIPISTPRVAANALILNSEISRGKCLYSLKQCTALYTTLLNTFLMIIAVHSRIYGFLNMEWGGW